MSIFSSREWASVVLYSFIVLFLIFYFKIDYISIIKSIFNKKLNYIYIVVLIYTFFITIIFYNTIYWHMEYIKDIFFWMIFNCISTVFRLFSKKLKKQYFIKIILDTIKITVIIEFIIGEYTFSFFVELIIIVILATVNFLLTFSETKNEYQQITKFFLFINTFINILILIYVFYNLYQDYSSILEVSVIIRFLIPIVYTLLAVPIYYYFIIYSKYDYIRCRIEAFNTIKNLNKKIIKRKKYCLIKTCNISYYKWEIFEEKFLKQLVSDNSVEDINTTIINFKNYIYTHNLK